MKKFNAMLWLFGILLFPLCAIAQEITALGFVEDKKAFELDGDYIRLAFVRTNAGWGPSCMFVEGNSTRIYTELRPCSHKIMNRSWQVVNADGIRKEVGSLKFRHRDWSQIGLTKSSRSFDSALKYDLTDSVQYAWDRKGSLPLLAVPSGTQIEKILPVVDKEPIKKEIRSKLVKEYLRKERKVYKCNPKTEELISERPALQKEIVVRPQKVYQDDWTFYEVLLPDSSNCGILDDGLEQIAVKENDIVNLSESSGALQDDRPYTTSLTLFNRYVVSTKKTKDTVYVFFVGGYNVDGYALFDSELNIKAISTWNYH